MKMTIIIPTDDGVTIADDFESARTIRWVLVEDGKISKELMHDNIDPGFSNKFATITRLNSDDRINPTIIMLMHGILSYPELAGKDYKLLYSTESNITNALIEYLNMHQINESDFCCEP